MPLAPTLCRIASVLLLLMLLAPVASRAEQAQTLGDVEQQIQDTTARLTALDEEIRRTQTLKSKLQKAVQEAETRVGERDQRLSDLSSDISDYDQTLASLEAQLQMAQTGVHAIKNRLAQALRNAQSIGKQTPLKILLQHDDPATADRMGIYTEHVLRAFKQIIDDQVTVLNRLDQARTSALKDRNWLNYLQKQASRQRQTLVSEALETQQSLTDVEAGLSQKTATVAELRADQTRLQSLMDELKALQSAPSGYFVAGKGQYPSPVVGQLIARFGEIKSVGKLRWNGLFIGADQGQPVRTVADGEVIYSDWLQGFGMLIIIDHGDNYSSLYGGNRDVTVAVGQWVESGSTIATVGDSGGQSVSGVYFEIRHNANATDPEAWLEPESGLQNTGS